ncbi:peroxiredoxin [Novosphingobium arvoryzae]|uniref:thioredoxin-dependent peroxiredoxin n=1 Tax=Novosphingobium arvoryzae TaxID=1256514 RepID=A0A918RFB9_9SPHN|nr:peroxiredoxin [Novosphingobium arvoryzae]GGZ95315.1 peroxiredoxin [Novosphingobium arvoryzae]
MMNLRMLLAAPVAVVMALSAPASAELPQGAKAPGFATQGALAGKVFGFNLSAALRKGPVVLYFYPKSFTQGCTLEAHGFAEAMPEFRKAGASVIGLSADTIDTQVRFSTEACRDAFPVGVATPAIIQGYKVALTKPDGSATGLTSRTSYVIGRDGTVKMVYTNMNYAEHVKRTLEAVRSLQPKRKG